MTEVSLLQIILFLVALVTIFVAATPYLPPWVAYVLQLGIALYAFTHLLFDGPSLVTVVLLISSVTAAATVWWRTLRRPESRS